MKNLFFTLCCCAAAAAMMLCGCADPKITNTGRNAVEQLLLTTAVDRSAAKLDFRMLAKEKVRFDYSLLATQVDKNYVQAAVEAEAAAAGAIIALKPEEAQYILRPVCAVLATDDNKILFGTPSLPIPVPDASLSIVIPELPLFKRVRRLGVCKLYVEVMDAKTNKQLRMVGPAVSQSVHTNWVILFVPFATRDFDMGESGSSSFHFFE